MKRIAGMSPRDKGRTAGVFDFLEGLTSAFGENIVPGTIVVAGDAATTAANILGQESLFRVALLAGFIAVVCHIVWTFLFYELFKPANRSIALLAAFVSIVAIGLQAASNLLQLAPLIVLQEAGSFSAFNTAQLQAIALMFLLFRAQLFNMYIALFGLWCILTGYLIFKSTFMPRVIGVLETIAGVCWLTFAWPPLGTALFPVIAALAGVGELSLQVWLLVFGVNPQRWNKQAAAEGGTEQ